MIVNCEEKSSQSQYFEAVDVGPYNTLRYPNVDSCLSITYVLDANYLVGGHAGWGANMNPAANALRVVNKMNQFVQNTGKSIQRIIFAGDLPTYTLTNLVPVSGNITAHKIDNTPGQSDIYVYSSRRWLTIERVNHGPQLFQGSIDTPPPQMTL